MAELSTTYSFYKTSFCKKHTLNLYVNLKLTLFISFACLKAHANKQID